MSPSSQLLLILSLLFNAYPAVNAACFPGQMIEPDCHVCNPHISMEKCPLSYIYLFYPEGFLAEMISPPTAISHETLDNTERTMFNIATDPRIATIPAKFDNAGNKIQYFYRYLFNCYATKESLRSTKCSDSNLLKKPELEKIKNIILKAPGNAKNQVVNTVFSLISNPASKPKNNRFSKSRDGFRGTWAYIFGHRATYFYTMVIFARHLINHNMYDADLIRWAYLQFQNYRFIGMGTVKYSGPQKKIVGLTMSQRFNQLGLYTSKFYLSQLSMGNGYGKIPMFTSTAYLEKLVARAKAICNVIEMPDSATGCISMAIYLKGIDNESAKNVYDALFAYDGNAKSGSIQYIHQNCAKWHFTDQCNNSIREYGASDKILLTIGGALKELYDTIAPQK